MRAILLLTLLLGCGDADSAPADDTAGAPVRFERTTLRIASGSDTTTWDTELAITAEQKTMGLMERRSLPANAAMLFVYDRDQLPSSGFWMFRTRIPLDIAFMDSAGVVRAIRQMEPCTATLAPGCPTYEPGVPYRYALEANAGAFARRGVREGSQVILPELPPQRP